MTRARLQLGAVADRQSEATAGSVVEQAPAPGTVVPPGTSVQIWLAVPTPVTVPDVRRQDRATAATTLTRARLQLGAVADRQSEATAGSVVEQAPAPGTVVPPGTSVQIWLAVPTPVTVPDVRRQDRATAATTLTRARLQLGAVADRQSEATAGSVVEQAPAPGTVVPPGTSVQIWLAVPTPVTVPDVRRQDRATAATTLAAAHLRLGDVGERQADGTVGVVVDQLPRPGATADRDTPVQIWLAVPTTITMPDLTDLTRLDAERQIAALGLTPGATADEGSPKPPGTVLRQRPLAGEQVAAGAAVDLVLAAALPATATPPATATSTATVTPPPDPAAPPPIRVPDVSGRSEAEAGAMLQAAGLRPGSVSKVAFRAGSGTVVNQFPLAGTDVPPGTAVALGVADVNLALLWMLGGVALGIAAAGVVSQVRRRRKLPSSVTYAPHPDDGTQTIAADRGGELPGVRIVTRGFPRPRGPVVVRLCDAGARSPG